MADRYFTANQRRRDAAARSAGPAPIHGIDFVDVDADFIDTSTHRNRPRLTVTLFSAILGASPAPPTAVITGGTGAPIQVQSVAFGAASDGSVDTKTLVVVADVRGDASSTYTLHLIRSAGEPVPPAGFDPLLSSVEFSFAPRLVREADCGSGPPRRGGDAPEPRIDYLAKDWESFRRLMLDRLSAIAPDWAERSPADLGAVLVEILAHEGDHLSYYQDAVATEAYLGTARRRVSVRRHARLLDYVMHEGCNARAWVSIEGTFDELSIERGKVKFLTRVSDSPAIPAGELGRVLEERRPEVFEPLQDRMLRGAHSRIALHTFGGDIPCLPAGATRATLDDDDGRGDRLLTLRNGDPSLNTGDVLVFEEVLGPVTGKDIDANPTRRHAVRLTRVTRYEDASSDNRRLLDVEWRPEDALPFSLCITNGTTTEPLGVARGNIVLVDHGLTAAPEELAEVPLEGRYRPRLSRRGLTYANGLPADPPPAARTLLQDPKSALPSMTVDEGGAPWALRHDLLRSRPGDREIVVEMDDRGAAHLRFGDGVLGTRPGPGTRLSATYRVGNGTAGNVGAGAIAHVLFTDPAVETSRITRVTNPLAAAGGTEPESLDHVRVAAPQSFRVQERAVTERDHAAAAERFPGVRAAAAFRRSLGSFDAHHIAVARTGGRPVDDTFKSELRAFLERFRLNGTEIVIEPPVLVKVDILLAVRIQDGHLRNSVHAALLAAFGTLELPDGRRGFFHPDNFSFGQPVYLGQVVRAVVEVGGVASVDTTDPNNLFRRRDRQSDDIDRGRITLGPLEIAARGTIDFHLEGGL